MQFKVNLITGAGGKREITIEGTSVQDASDQMKELYPGYSITNVDLIPKKNHIRVYQDGEQIEIPQGTIYKPF